MAQHVELLNDSVSYTRKINGLVSEIYELNNKLAGDLITNEQFIEQFKALQDKIRIVTV